jgi:plastocyanin
MKKSWIVVGVVALLLVLGVVAYLLSRTDGMNMSNSSGSTSQTETPTATNSVDIKNFSFMPASITVKKGTTVTWTNSDSSAHTVTESDGQSGPHSLRLTKGQSYTFTFDNVGTFKYICSLHPDMKGIVTVTE